MTVLNFFVAKLVTAAGKRKASVYLRYQHAEGNDENAQDLMASEASLTAFCFPLGPDVVAPKEYMATEEYTFTLTGGNGRRYQGFCRKFLPPKPAAGSKLQLPQVMCLVSEDPWHAFFFKVLQVLEHLVKSADQLIGSDNPQLPPASLTARFLQDLGTQLAQNPKPSEVVKLALPVAVDLLGVGPQRMIENTLALAEQSLQLQVPIDCANGRWNCGISLARLLWTVPPACLTTLLAAMLLERRIVLTSFQRDTVTAAVQAAAALLYPFKWHHIYLPMLPSAFKDYLSAPMPFMVGLPGQMLGILSSIPMDDTVVVDLDLGTCKPSPGSQGDDAKNLPWREQLETALAAAHKRIRSPTEHETSPLIAGILQEYFVKLFGSYRRFIHSDSPAHSARFSPQHTHHIADKLHHTANPSPGNGHGHHSMSSPRPRRESSFGRFTGHHHNTVHIDPTDRVIKGYGYVFEHAAFIHSHRRNPKVQQFLASLRGSQMYAQFIQERLEMAAAGKLEDSIESFEQRLDRYQERRKQHAMLHRSSRTSPLTVKWYHNIKRHRRTDSEEQAMMTRSMDASVESLTSQTGSMRRIVTDPHSLAPCQGTSDIDPSTFFPIEDDDEVLIGEEVDGSESTASLLATTSSGIHSTVHPGDVRNHTLQSAPSQNSTSLEAPSLSFSDRSSNNTLFRQELQAHSFGGHMGRQSSDAVVLQRYLQQAKLISSPQKQPQAGGPHSHGHVLSPIPSTESPPVEGKFKTMMKGALHDIKDVFTRRSQNGSVQGANSSQGGALVNSASFNQGSHHTPSHSFNNQPPGFNPAGRVSGGGYRRQVTGSDGPNQNRTGGFFSKYVPQLTGDQQPGRGLLSKYVPQLTGGNGLGSGHVSVLDVARGLLNKPPAPSRPVSACSTPQMPERPGQAISSPSHATVSPFVTPNDTAAWPMQPEGSGAGTCTDHTRHDIVPCNLQNHISVPAPPEFVQQQGADKQGTEAGHDHNAGSQYCDEDRQEEPQQDGSSSSVGPALSTKETQPPAHILGDADEVPPLVDGIEDGFSELAGRTSSHNQTQSAPQLSHLQKLDQQLTLLDL